MRNLAGRFLSQEERQRISACVKEVERGTSGEIVPMVVSSSYHYPMAALLGALIGGLVIATAFTIVLTLHRAWGGLTLVDLWVFPALFGVSLVVLHELVRRVPALKRLFITTAEIEEEVEEAALTSFYRRGLQNTRDRTGVLIFVSVFEHRARILADEGINARVDKGAWQSVVDRLSEGIRRGRQGEAICQAVRACGEMIRNAFPIKPGDSNELDNLIVEE
jgi:putative membrane protein